jgi:hypothetical protein
MKPELSYSVWCPACGKACVRGVDLRDHLAAAHNVPIGVARDWASRLHGISVRIQGPHEKPVSMLQMYHDTKRQTQRRV